MFGHQVIEDLRKYKSSPQSHKFDFDSIERVIRTIQKAQHFHFESAEEIVEVLNIKKGASLFLDKQGEFINPPYNTCWFDFHVKENDRINKIGYIFYEVAKSWITCLCIEYNTRLKVWTPWPLSYLVGLGIDTSQVTFEELKQITNISDIKYSLGSNILATQHLSLYKEDSFSTDLLGVARDGIQLLAYLNFALMLLNCQNIKTVITSPNPNLNKKRKKRRKQELFSYHTLKIALPIEKSEKGYSNKSDHSARLHLCRGHFKTYSSENPLFGRVSGRFWWQPQIRGDKKLGIAIKDYDVKTKLSNNGVE